MNDTRARLQVVASRLGRWRIVWALGYANGMGSLWAVQHRSNLLAYVVLAVAATGVLAVAAQRIGSEEDAP